MSCLVEIKERGERRAKRVIHQNGGSEMAGTFLSPLSSLSSPEIQELANTQTHDSNNANESFVHTRAFCRYIKC